MKMMELLPLKVYPFILKSYITLPYTVLQIRRGKRDYLGITFFPYESFKKYFVTHH